MISGQDLTISDEHPQNTGSETTNTGRLCLATSSNRQNTSTNKRKHSKKNPDEPLSEAIVNNVQNTALVEQRRDQICEAALTLFLEKGFASTTIRDICAKSGVNQASIYDYIANKNDILRRLLNKQWFRPDVPTLAQRLENDSDLSLQENVANYFRDTWSKKRQGTLLAYRTVPYLQDDDRKAMRAREKAIAKELMSQLESFTQLPADDPTLEVIAQVIIYLAAFGPMRDWLIKKANNETTLRVVSAGVAAMVDQLAKENSGSNEGK
ncbi:MAG: TetR/AcrR family transcriptional regulator [Nitrospinaceae bacterium]|nr:TetR/AcrR family transcriptional regulator [Nitrospinaceae bacterium]